MKHLMLTFALLLSTLAAMAQPNLRVGKLFDGRFRGNRMVTETHIKGAKLDKYDLDEYHSLTFLDNAQTALVESVVLDDAPKARHKEVSYVDGNLYFGFYTFYEDVDYYHYIFYLNNQLKKKDTVTLIYMRGEARPEQVKKMLKK